MKNNTKILLGVTLFILVLVLVVVVYTGITNKDNNDNKDNSDILATDISNAGKNNPFYKFISSQPNYDDMIQGIYTDNKYQIDSIYNNKNVLSEFKTLLNKNCSYNDIVYTIFVNLDTILLDFLKKDPHGHVDHVKGVIIAILGFVYFILAKQQGHKSEITTPLRQMCNIIACDTSVSKDSLLLTFNHKAIQKDFLTKKYGLGQLFDDNGHIPTKVSPFWKMIEFNIIFSDPGISVNHEVFGDFNNRVILPVLDEISSKLCKKETTDPSYNAAYNSYTAINSNIATILIHKILNLPKL